MNESQMIEIEKQSAVSYLLGAMTDAERSAFEESCFSNDYSVERLDVVRDELIDEYLDGDLSPTNRERFESYFLTAPYHLRKVEFAGLLRETLAKAARPVIAPSCVTEESLWQRIPLAFPGAKHRAVAIALVALMTVCGALFYVFWRPRGTAVQSPQMANVNNRTSPAAPDSAAKVNNDAEQPSTVQKRRSAANSPVRDAERILETRGTRTVTFALHAVTRSSEEVSSLILHPGVSAVRLVIDQPANGYAHYRASLSTVEGKEVWSQNLRMPPATAKAKRTLTIPADLLSAEDYILRITGTDATGEKETVSQYYFRIIRRSAGGGR